MTTRSLELFGGNVTPHTSTLLFTVPPQGTVILKSAYGYSYGYEIAGVILIIRRAGADYNFATMETTSGKGYRWDGWLVLEPQDELRAVFSGDVGVSLWVSGALLEGTAQ